MEKEDFLQQLFKTIDCCDLITEILKKRHEQTYKKYLIRMLIMLLQQKKFFKKVLLKNNYKLPGIIDDNNVMSPRKNGHVTKRIFALQSIPDWYTQV